MRGVSDVHALTRVGSGTARAFSLPLGRGYGHRARAGFTTMRLPFRILVLQGDPTALAQLVDLLRDAQYLVTGAATTDAAKRLLDLGTFDLLITDGPLRQLNGKVFGRQPPAVPAEMALLVVTRRDDNRIVAEAQEYGAQVLRAPVQPREFLTCVARCLRAVRRPRRWERKPVLGTFRVVANGQPANVLDVCYGGLRIEIPHATHLPDAFDVEIPGIGLHLQVEPVWTLRSADGLSLTCGVALAADGTPAARTWRAIVDRLGA